MNLWRALRNLLPRRRQRLPNQQIVPPVPRFGKLPAREADELRARAEARRAVAAAKYDEWRAEIGRRH